MTSGSMTAVRSAPETEYTIYTFQNDSGQRNSGQHNNPTHWQKHDTIQEMDKALNTARSLFDSGRYCRIEVKQRIFDRRARRTVYTTLKTYGSRKNLKLGLIDVVAFAMLCGAMAFLLTWVLSGRG